MTAHILHYVIPLAGGTVLFVGGIGRLAKKETTGWTLVFTGLIVLGNMAVRLFQEASHRTMPWTLPHLLDHFASMLAGAALVLLILVIVQEMKRKKVKRQ